MLGEQVNQMHAGAFEGIEHSGTFSYLLIRFIRSGSKSRLR